MKTIVFVDNEKHSAWDDARQARKQVAVLINNGYRDVHFVLNVFYAEIHLIKKQTDKSIY